MVDIIPYVIGSRSIGTSTTSTQLSGDQSGNATNYVVPTWVSCFSRVTPYICELTPTAAQTCFATLLPSSSAALGIGFYEVPAQPLGSVLGATATTLSPGQQTLRWPWNLGAGGALPGQSSALLKGASVQFNGQAQVANTVAPNMGAVIWQFAGGVDTTLGGLWQSLWTSIGQSSSNPVAAGVVDGATTNGTPFTSIPGTGKIKIRGAYGALLPTTIVASDQGIGFWNIFSSTLPKNINVPVEPIQGFLGATGQAQTQISKVEGIYEDCLLPVTLQNTLTLDQAPDTAANFEVGIMFQY